jgi:hypothetical protein
VRLEGSMAHASRPLSGMMVASLGRVAFVWRIWGTCGVFVGEACRRWDWKSGGRGSSIARSCRWRGSAVSGRWIGFRGSGVGRTGWRHAMSWASGVWFCLFGWAGPHLTNGSIWAHRPLRYTHDGRYKNRWPN